MYIYVCPLLLIWSLSGRSADAHGVWCHVHVTGWAIENLPEGELRDFFADPEVFNAAIFGSAFTDSGYAVVVGEEQDAARDYGEHTHWEPFVENAVNWIRENDPPPWDSQESRLRVAFLMGAASHGLQDEIFDSLFLYQVDEHDAQGQDGADPAVDGFLAIDGHLRFVPEVYVPMDMLLELFSGLSHEITEDVINKGVDMLTSIYINGDAGIRIAEASGRSYARQLPWTHEHYLDPAIPGSIFTEIAPTGHYIEALWDRFHDQYSDEGVVTHAYPAAPRRLLSHVADSPDSWVTFVFGQGVDIESASLTWAGADDSEVGFSTRNTRWGAHWSRLIRILPDQDLVPGAWYTVTLGSGADTIGGAAFQGTFEHTFQVACEDESAECPDLGEIDDPRIDGLEEPVEPEMDMAEEIDIDARVEIVEDMADVGTAAEATPSPEPSSGCRVVSDEGRPRYCLWLAAFAGVLAMSWTLRRKHIR